MLSAALTGAAAFLKFDERAARHGRAAADFQALRREMDEESVRLAEGGSSHDYSAFKTRWYQVLKAAPPLPQSIHDRVKREIDEKHKE
jgi:hypothetical protein